MTTSATSARGAKSAAAAEAEAAIRKVVEQYYVGLRDADLKSLGAAFNDLAIVCGYIGPDLYVKHVKTLYDYVLGDEPPSKKGDSFTCDVTSIEIAGDTAAVTLEEHNYLGYDYTTYLHLIRDDTRWSIVSKLFEGTQRANE
jgi:Putative lumazine-binding